MKFDIARKVVKFQNGQYGIRRWTFIGYQYLGLNPASQFYWWLTSPGIAEYAAGTENQARARLAQYLKPKAKPTTPGFDKGQPA